MSDLASRITDPKEMDSEGQAKKKAKDIADAKQMDSSPAVANAVVAQDGPGLQEPEWDVEVSLSELQNNEATPFHSATTWQDLGLYVVFPRVADVPDMILAAPSPSSKAFSPSTSSSRPRSRASLCR